MSSKITNGFSKANGEARKVTKVLGFAFASLYTALSIPIETLAVLIWVIPLLMGPVCLLLLLYLFFYTNYGWISSAYLVHFLYSKNICNEGGRTVNFIRNWSVWKKYCDYFPLHLVKTAELDPKKNYLLAYHPHGIMPCGVHGAFSTEGRGFSKLFVGIKQHVITLHSNFYWPITRDYFMAFGACSSSRQSLNHLLSVPEGGHATILVPGGAPESLESRPGKAIKIHLNRRKDFIKVAIQNGVSLVPVYGFGETDIFDQVANPEESKLWKFQNRMEKLIGVAPVAVIGRGIFQYTWGFPRRHPIHVVVGAPIETVKIINPTQEDIDSLHKKYCAAVMDLFNKHKAHYGYKFHTLKLA